MVHQYMQDELVQYIIGEIAILTDLGETFDSAMQRTRQALLDIIDIGCLTSMLLHDHATAAPAEDAA